MDLVLAFLGVLLILIILWDAFETIILPRRVARRLRLTSLFYRSVWWPWSSLTERLTSGKQTRRPSSRHSRPETCSFNGGVLREAYKRLEVPGAIPKSERRL